MCGFCGWISLDGSPPDLGRVRRMTDALVHRGPDDAGDYADGPLALGFRRLSILDLEGGHQPMETEDGTLSVVFNGEIYNHPSLRSELEAEGARYRTRSDTETILHAFKKHGKEALGRLRGMFALALWNRREGRLLLARDPMGIKPLYYAQDDRRLIFASELKALVRAGVPLDVDPLALWDYLSYGYVHAPRTILSAVRKLQPGHWMEIDGQGDRSRFSGSAAASAGTSGSGAGASKSPEHDTRLWRFHRPRAPRGGCGGGIRTGRFWDLPRTEPVPMTARACEERLEELMTRAVRSHLLSDVPVGAFLSGGVDSSLVTALMAKNGAVETFSIGFEGVRAGLDESSYAREVARHLGTRHHELILPSDVLNRLEEGIECLDEPLGDSAILPTYLLSKHARERVKVVLTGEGADELFAGYPRYKAAYVDHMASRWPGWLRSGVLGCARRFGRGAAFKQLPMDGIRDWAVACRLSTSEGLDPFLAPGFKRSIEKEGIPAWLNALNGLSGFNGVLAHDLRTVLADVLLMKVDKSSMRASLEARVPYLDLDIVTFALQVPPELKVKLFKGKWILRKLASKYLPTHIARRRKHGFWVPWEEWMRSPNPAVDEALESLKPIGLLDTDALVKSLKRLREGSRHEDAGLLYRVAVLALWHRKYVASRAVSGRG